MLFMREHDLIAAIHDAQRRCGNPFLMGQIAVLFGWTKEGDLATVQQVRATECPCEADAFERAEEMLALFECSDALVLTVAPATPERMSRIRARAEALRTTGFHVDHLHLSGSIATLVSPDGAEGRPIRVPLFLHHDSPL